MPVRPDFQQKWEAIEELIGRIEEAADPALKAASRQLLEAVMAFHGLALERMLEMLQEGGESGLDWIDKLGNDGLVSCLLVLHGLHPLCLEDRVEKALEKVRPSLQKRGGDVEILGTENGDYRLRLRANGHGSELKAAVEAAVYQAAPDIASLTIEGPEDRASFVPLEMLRSAAGTKATNGHASASAGKGDL